MFARQRGSGFASAILATLVVATTSCGSGNGPSDNGSGSPITVLVMASISNPNFSLPEFKPASEAFVSAINAGGGIHGHPLKLIFCDTKFDPNVEAACARTAIQSKAAAVIGGLDLFPNTIPVLQQGGIPYIGNQGYGKDAYTSSVSFPLSSGPVGAEAGVAQMVLAGHTKMGILVLDNPSATEIQHLFEAVIRSAGLEPTSSLAFPATATDLTASFGAALQNGTNGLLLVTGPGPLSQARKLLDTFGYSGGVQANDAQIPNFAPGTPELAALNGFDVVGPVLWPTRRSTNPAIQAFYRALDTYAPGTRIDSNTLQTYAGFQLFERLPGNSSR